MAVNLATGIGLLRPFDAAARAIARIQGAAPATGIEGFEDHGIACRSPQRWGLAVRALRQRPLEETPAAGTAARGVSIAPSLEIQIGRANFLPFWFLELGAVRGRAVCKVKAAGVSHDGATGTWNGSGFMVSPSVLLTNHHVLNSPEVAREAACIFDYEEDPTGNVKQTTSFPLRPDRLFLTSPVDRGLDYTFVWVDGEPGHVFGYVPLDRSAFPVVEKEYVNIIQHPSGGPKTVVLQENEVVSQDPVLIHYETDTGPGSSGSCVFTNEWRPVALHHASVPSDGRVLNEGVKLSAIATHVETQMSEPALRPAAEEVLRLFGGSDEVLGFFGSLGRHTSAGSCVEAVTDCYRGEASDVDVAFWRVGLPGEGFEPKLTALGQVVSRLNFDVWALADSSSRHAEALVDHLRERYGLDFAWAASERGAAPDERTTTVLWNTATVAGEPRAWPSEIDAWLRVHGTEPAGAVPESADGRVFDRYPGLFHFRALNRDRGRNPFELFLVPLHLERGDAGGKRRRIASRILLAAAHRMIEHHGADADWILGGDFSAPLASEDFAALEDAGLVPLGAEDEHGAALSYLRRPRSLLDHVFLSPNLARTYGARDYAVVSADRSIPPFLADVSDQPPLLARLSLKDTGEVAPAGLPADLAAEMRKLFDRDAQAAGTAVASAA